MKLETKCIALLVGLKGLCIIKQMIHKILLNIATLWRVGKIPKAPGTWGTLAALPAVYLLSQAGSIIYMIVVLLLIPLGIVAAEVFEKQAGTHDSKEIVIDEVIGIFITMTWMPHTWQAFLAGFVLFRFLDILKPPPIRYFDRRIRGGVGVVIDDVVAGIIANIFLQILYSQTPWLGQQFLLIT